jgi:hypothetical protein
LGVTIDTSVLLGWYLARSGVPSTAAAAGAAAPVRKYAPTPPWDVKATMPRESDLVRQVMGGRKFIDEGAAKLDLSGASADYRKLFALYQSVNALYGLASQASAKGISSYDLARYGEVFDRGLAETFAYVNSLSLAKLRVTAGEVAAKAETETGAPVSPTTYLSRTLHTGGPDDPVAAFQGAVAFNITIQRGSTTLNVPVDLAEMGATPRTMANVVIYLNGKLETAGALTRFATNRVVGLPRVVGTGAGAVTLPPGPDTWSLKIKGDSTEAMTFSTPATNGAVYLAQTVGHPNPDGDAATDDANQASQLLKFQTDGTPPPPLSGETNYVAGRLFAQDLGPSVKTVRATQVAADGSVYVLADVDNLIQGQTIKGEQDVALLKYDGAGNLIFARTLGAASSASGLALGVAADGKVAVAGSVAGELDPGESVFDTVKTDSFVTLFDAGGNEVWTQRRAAREEDQANAVAFGADGTVYVAGQAKSAIPGSAGALGGWDGYLAAFGTAADGSATAKFVTQFGAAGDDKPAAIAVDGTNVVVAGVEGGHAVLRRFDVSSGVTETASRDLGDLQGGSLAGLAISGGVITLGGSTRNAALAAGTVTAAHAGGLDAFAATLSADLGPAGGDAVAYFGGSGDDRATGLAVSGGKAWLTGEAGADLPGLAAVGTRDGFLVSLDVATGATDFARRFTGRDGYAAPTAIAAAPAGASILDQLGLPQGTINAAASAELTANSSLRAGDEFYIRTREGGPLTAVTIGAHDTLEDLALKVQRATGFSVSALVMTIDGERQLQIKPLNQRSTVELVAGRPGRDALAPLGLDPGVVRNTTTVKGKTVSADGGGEVYGLGLPNDLSLATPEAAKAAMAKLSDVMATIRAAYRDLLAAATPKSAQAPTGPVPAYLKSQIANYQAALDRLTAGT